METVQQIREKLAALEGAELEEALQAYTQDPRGGVQTAVKAARSRQDRLEKEIARVDRMLAFEREYAPYGPVCGIDEAGRGPLAGPVVAAAVVLPENCRLLYVNDSKQLSEKKREELFDVIMEKALSVGVGMASPERIDQINILQADYEAMREAVSKLSVRPAVFLNDAVTIPGLTGRQVPLIKGDARSLSIAAASIIAKVTRDRMMRDYDRIFPEYGFAGHKGYGSAAHMEAIRTYGPCPIHRRTFLKNLLGDAAGNGADGA